MNKQSSEYKHQFIQFFGMMYNQLNNDVIILTQGGFISGTIELFDKAAEYPELPEGVNKIENFDQMRNQFKIMVDQFDKMRSESIKDVPDSELFPKGFYLSDAKIVIGDSAPKHMPIVFIFYDQVLGVSFGNVEDQNGHSL